MPAKAKSQKTKPQRTLSDVATKPSPVLLAVADSCPSCGLTLERVGTKSRAALFVCRNDKKAFVGSPPSEATTGTAKPPTLYEAITNKHEATLNIADVTLD